MGAVHRGAGDGGYVPVTKCVLVNRVTREVPADATLADAVGEVTGETAGIAVALNGVVVPRRAWPATTISEGDRVEVVTAMQGG